jgi:hypothetical protein
MVETANAQNLICVWVESMIGSAHAQNLNVNIYMPSKTRMPLCKVTAKTVSSKIKVKQLDNFHIALKYQNFMKFHLVVLELLYVCRRTDTHSSLHRYAAGLEMPKKIPNSHPGFQFWGLDTGPHVCTSKSQSNTPAVYTGTISLVEAKFISVLYSGGPDFKYQPKDQLS